MFLGPISVARWVTACIRRCLCGISTVTVLLSGVGVCLGPTVLERTPMTRVASASNSHQHTRRRPDCPHITPISRGPSLASSIASSNRNPGKVCWLDPVAITNSETMGGMVARSGVRNTASVEWGTLRLLRVEQRSQASSMVKRSQSWRMPHASREAILACRIIIMVPLFSSVICM
jgi:hypothetical protein